MEVYILDSFYRRTAVVDRFESLIWTDRWVDPGDFELLVPSTPVNRSLFIPDTRLALNEAKSVMEVETVEDGTDADGRGRLSVKGRSLEKLLDERMLVELNDVGVPLEKLHFEGTPKDVAELMFTVVCRNGAVNIHDIIPLLAVGNSYPADTIPADTTSYVFEPEPDKLLTLLQDICKVFKMGIRLYRNGDAGQLFFNVYTGSDRTTRQTTLPPVVFSKNLETLQNTRRLITKEKARNVAYVYNEQGFQIVYADGVDPLVDGFERRVIPVKPAKLMIADIDTNGNAVQVDPTPTELSNYFIAEAKKAFASNSQLLAFDGEVSQYSLYKYGVHYQMGDLVEMQDEDGSGNIVRVTEQIFASDANGDRSYPTLSVDSFVVAGTWDSWLGKREWASFGATEYWNTMP